jgi:hypothetical protein
MVAVAMQRVPYVSPTGPRKSANTFARFRKVSGVDGNRRGLFPQVRASARASSQVTAAVRKIEDRARHRLGPPSGGTTRPVYQPAQPGARLRA